jgi:hypothetical protein
MSNTSLGDTPAGTKQHNRLDAIHKPPIALLPMRCLKLHHLFIENRP